jgi:hypothetical protein
MALILGMEKQKNNKNEKKKKSNKNKNNNHTKYDKNNKKNRWVSGLCPTSGILNTRYQVQVTDSQKASIKKNTT